MPMAEQYPERFFFVHLQKTAGTTLRERIAATLGTDAVYPNRTDGTDVYSLMVSVDHLQERLRARGDEIRVIAGHFPLCTTEMLDGSYRTFTVLREPVARTLSYLRHHRSRTPEDHHKSLEEIYDDPFRFHGFAHNHMVKMFSLTVEEMTAGMLTRVEFTADRLERAKQNLVAVEVVGVQERFEEMCDALRRHFGWDLPDEPRIANRTEPVGDDDVSEAFLARIVEDQAPDIELYDLARRLSAQHQADA
jgi:hypothetical protein